jgi:hypothetical protein
MKTIVTITTPPLEWSRQKLVEMKRDILLFLAQQCAPNALWEETPVSSEPVKAQPEHVHLKCMSCAGTTWYAKQFTPCPTCNQRTTVRKATIKKSVPPEGALVLTV